MTPALRLAALLQQRLPRAKGASSRLVGRLFGVPGDHMVTRHGAKLVMDRGCYDVYATMALNNGAWDYHDFLKCYASVPDGSVFYDIGANVGYFSIEIAARTNQAVEIVAFEPQTSLATTIRKSADLNGFRIAVINALVGDHDGTADFYLSRSSIHASAVSDSGRLAVSVSQCPMITIDALVSSKSHPAPDFIKMDVEGSEHFVLDGAARTISQFQPNMFIEYATEYDPGGRIRTRLEEILAQYPGYVLGGDPRMDRRNRYEDTWYPINSDEGWGDCHAVYLLNRSRRLRDAAMFKRLWQL